MKYYLVNSEPKITSGFCATDTNQHEQSYWRHCQQQLLCTRPSWMAPLHLETHYVQD